MVIRALAWKESNVRAPIAGYLFAVALGPKFFGAPPPSEEKAKELRDKAVASAGNVEKLLAGRPFLAGNELSIADVAAAAEVQQLGFTPDLLKDYLAKSAAVAKWYETVTALPSFVEASKPLNAMLQGSK